ncbi:MAG: hypothetical protein ABGX05_09295, partial [Pirellulaceae bacterium]
SCPDSGEVVNQGSIENPTVVPTVVCSSCRRFMDGGDGFVDRRGQFMYMFLAGRRSLLAMRLPTVN